MKNKKWIQSALKYHKKGSLSRQLGIPVEKKIPNNLLIKIKNLEIGEKIHVNKKNITITSLLKKRANFALNLKRIKK